MVSLHRTQTWFLKLSLKILQARYTDHEWSGIWTDLSIEQQLMRAVKSSGGLTGGRLRTQESAHTLWTATFNQMALINQTFADALVNLSKRQSHSKAVIHSDLSKSSKAKNCEAFKKLMTWFNETVDFEDSDNKNSLISYSTGLKKRAGWSKSRRLLYDWSCPSWKTEWTNFQ